MEKENRFFPLPGALLGKLKVLGLIQDIYNHPLRESTPKSYLKQGHLYECACECGNHVLISEYVLSKGENKSCGCLRRSRSGQKWEQKQRALEHKLKRDEINDLIRRLSYEIAQLKIMDSRVRDEKRLSEAGAELRAAHAKKASLAAQFYPNGNKKKRERKITNRDKIDHLNKIGVLPDFEARALAHAAREIERKRGLSG